LREAAVSGEIETLLNWIPVSAGDAFFIPAGTVHAIGAGLAICEIQQYSDVTYRLYDYGRPRELHLEKAAQVAELKGMEAKPVSLPIDCKFFHTESARIALPFEYQPEAQRFHVLIFLSGLGTIGNQDFQEGQAWLVPPGSQAFTIAPQSEAVKFLRTWVP
jgi:mannose-6-phosphate isomerase